MLRLAINGRFYSRINTGVDRYAREVVRALDEALDVGAPWTQGLDVEILVPRGLTQVDELKCIPICETGRFPGQIWEQLELPSAARGRLLLGLGNTGPVNLQAQVVVIHDVASLRYPEAFNWRFRYWYRFLMPRLATVAARIATVSDFAARELIEVCGAPPEKVRRVHEGAEHLLRVPARPEIVSRSGLDRRPFFLCVGNRARYKNLDLVLKAMSLLERPPFDLAIVGRSVPRLFGERPIAASPNVNVLGPVTDGELRALYEHAHGFVFPSLYEGFGLPLVEAMALGCPVLAADAGSIPEVCAGAARLFDPRDAQALAQALSGFAHDVALRRGLVDAGHARAAELRWQQTAQQLVSVCHEAASLV